LNIQDDFVVYNYDGRNKHYCKVGWSILQMSKKTSFFT